MGLLPLFLLLMIASPLAAQLGRVGVHAGPVFAMKPMGAARELATGWTVGASALASFASLPLDVEFGAGYMENAYDDGGSPSGQVETWTAGASGIWRPTGPAAGVQPYVLGGFGVYYVEEPDRNKITPAFSAGAGVRFLLRRVQLFAEARYHYVFYTGDDLRLLPVVLGVRYTFTP